jgi:hypothetical protein
LAWRVTIGLLGVSSKDAADMGNKGAMIPHSINVVDSRNLEGLFLPKVNGLGTEIFFPREG